MQRLLTWSLALCLLASPALAGNGPGDATPGTTKDGKPAPAAAPANTDTAKPGATSKAAASTPANSTPSIDEELQQMRAIMEAQAKQLADQQAALQEQQKEMDALREQLHAASVSPSNAGAMNNGLAMPASATSGNGALAPNAAATVASGQYADDKDQKSPLSFKIGDAQFTPGGFADFTTYFRTTNVGSGIGTSFGGIPYNNTVPAGGLSETGFSAQNSRISLKVDSHVAGATVVGYTEADFLGNAPTNLLITSNSDTFRLRLYFVDARWGKWDILGGQDWSLLTPNRKGIGFMPSDIFYSQDMDTNYQVGLTWTRDAQFRAVYHATDSWAMAISLENPQQFTGSATFPSLFSSGQVNTGSNGTSTPNVFPDVIAKIAHDHDFSGKNWHFEVAGVLSSVKLYTPASVTTTSATTNTKVGGGVAANLNLELVKNFHLIANSFWSDGDGRYIDALGPNFIVNQNTVTSPFVPSLVHAGSGIGGFEWQLHKSMLYGYYGGAYYGRDFSPDPNKSGALVGYGYNGSSNSNNRAIQEGTLGVIQTFWKSPSYGALQLITQLSYLTRAPWFVATGAPKNAHLTMAYIDLRYMLP
jgi:hypothetical protein